jgi:hypothetical protein
LAPLDALQDPDDLRFTEATLAPVICPLPSGGIVSHPLDQLPGFMSWALSEEQVNMTRRCVKRPRLLGIDDCSWWRGERPQDRLHRWTAFCSRRTSAQVDHFLAARRPLS